MLKLPEDTSPRRRELFFKVSEQICVMFAKAAATKSLISFVTCSSKGALYPNAPSNTLV